MSEERNFSLTAFIVGGFLGASAVLLYNPKSGKDIRREIKMKTGDYLNKTRIQTNDFIRNSKSSAELLKRKAEDVMDTVQQYARGKLNKSVSEIEKEISALRAAMTAIKTSYSLHPEFHQTDIEGNNSQLFGDYLEDETLPKQLGMGKGRTRKSFS